MQGTEEEAAQDDAAARDEEGQNDAASDAGSGQGQPFATFVAEAAHLQELVAAMGDDEGIVGRICTILDRYQEQPQLLDPHLESIITPLAATLRSACGLGGKDGESLAGVREVRLACRVLYVLAKVRGFKVVIKFFPHSVTDLEPCLDLIVRQDALDVETWETRYVLLLWLSILVMVPFGLNTVDSATSGSNLIERIVDVCKKCLGEAAKTRDAAAYLLARLLTRPDMDDKAPGEGGAKTVGSAPIVAFLQWCVVQMEGSGGQLLLTGVHQALANIFKMGQRNSLLDKVSMVSDVLHSQTATAGLSTTQRHNTCKLAQRLGLTYLPPRVAAWRYTRGHRSLLDNLRDANSLSTHASSSSSEHATVASTANAATDASRAKAQAETDRGGEDDDEDDAFVPIEIEYVIDSLLQGLQDRDTVVRWSGAKGLGRVAARLPKHLANEVVEAVMALFTIEDASTVNTWHGGCLALAELARRGILLPERLEQAVGIVHKALVFDVRRGTTSIGAHVRDAAAYVCWAFARAYAPAEMAIHVRVLARSLLVAALYDREINCRRAAAAAFQENVGRQGNYPHGIDIVTRADYFALGNRSNAFLVVAPFVASFPEYQEALANHLVTRQLRHWDLAMRELSATALRKLVPLFPHFFVANALPSLLDAALSTDVPTRHGGACSIAQILLGLKDCGHKLPSDLETRIVGLVPAVEKARLFRGRGGEAMRGACCRAGLPLQEAQIQRFMVSVAENLKHPTEDIAKSAVAAVHALSRGYFGGMSVTWQGELVKQYLSKLEDSNPAARRGFALALGALAPAVLGAEDEDQVEPEEEMVVDEVTGEVSGGGGGGAIRRLDAAVNGLAKAATFIQEDKDERDAEARRNAVRALVTIVEAVGVGDVAGVGGGEQGNHRRLQQNHVETVLNALLTCLTDYSTDNRGDVGSWVREAAMLGLEQVLPPVAAHHARAVPQPAWLTPAMVKRVIDQLIQQLCEKIDRIRTRAGASLLALLTLEPPLPCVPQRELLTRVLQNEESPGTAVDWNSPAVAFPRLVHLVEATEYTRAAVSGLVISVGGLSESLVKHSWDALLRLLQKEPLDTRLRVATALTATLSTFKGIDRVIIPVFKTAHLFLTNGFLDELDETDATHTDIPKDLLLSAQHEMRGSNDVVKLEAGANLVAALLQFPFGSVRVPSLQTLLAFLCHKFPRVRRRAAEELYMQVLTHEGIVREEGMEEAMRVLPETDWTQPVADLKPIRDSLYAAFGVERVVVATTGPKKTPGKQSQDDSYKQFVKEMHY